MRRSGSGVLQPKKDPGKGHLLELTVDRLSWGGRGVGRHRGKVVFVPKAVPGDHLLVRPETVRASFMEGRIVGVLTRGADRVEPHCPWFERCGGCQWLAASYPRQLQEKGGMLSSALRHHLEGAQITPIQPAEPVLAYRHRGDFQVKTSAGGARLGFFEEGSHRLVEVKGCLLFSHPFETALGRVREVLGKFREARCVERLTLSHSEEGTGFAAHLRLGPGGNETLATDLLGRLKSCLLQGLVITGSRNGRPLAAAGTPHLWFGVPGSRNELRLRADVRSFTQAHFAMNRKMVAQALSWLNLSKTDRVLDLYSGVGNFSLPMATECREVVSVEGGATACGDARFNGESNGLQNIRHLEGDSGTESERLAADGERFDAILLDPPRAGAGDALPAIARLGASRLLYVSCNLPSLERDLGQLRALGYRLTRLQGFDLFPQTYGLEALCLLEKC